MTSNHKTLNAADTIKPSRLSAGDTLGIIAPSSPFDKQKFYKGLSVVEDMGFTVFVPENIFEQKGYLAGSDVHRADILSRMFTDPAIKGIVCARGGYGALRILSLIDFKAIAANPKILIGCSDVTALLNTFYARCRLVSFHGPMVETLSCASDKTKQAFKDMLLTDKAVTLISEKSYEIFSGKASGVLCGGNLTTLSHMVGTPFEPDFSGQILLLEDIGEPPYKIDRMLTHMKMAGCFANINGIVLGSFKGCGDLDLVYQVFDDIFAKDNIPILAGFEIGHDDPNMTIPFGVHASFDTGRKLIVFNESPFSN